MVDNQKITLNGIRPTKVTIKKSEKTPAEILKEMEVVAKANLSKQNLTLADRSVQYCDYCKVAAISFYSGTLRIASLK